MNNEVAKTIATSAVWLAVGCILTFGGIFKLQGDLLVVLVMVGVPAVVAYAAMEATKAIWRSKEDEKPPVVAPPTTFPPGSPEAR